MAYITRMQQKYEHVCYSNLFAEPTLSKDKTTLRFQVDCLDRAGTKRRLEAVAILTIQKGKICYWQEVFQDRPPILQ